MPAGYSKAFMPLDKVKEKEFMSRPMGCKGVGFSFVRCKPGEARPTCIVTKCRKRFSWHSRETVRLSSMGKGSRCPRER